jgi:carboxyl-terminal processing protease
VTDKALRPFLIAIALIAAFFVGAWVQARSDGVDFIGDVLGRGDASLTSEAIDVIDDNYFEQPDHSDLENASVGGMVKQLRAKYKDRFSHYFTPEAYERFREVTEGRFSGVGMSVAEVPRGLRVSEVFDGAPAKRGGIKPGDVITEVNGKSIAGKDSDLAVNEIKGPEGTEVKLTVKSPKGEERQVELTREQVSVPPVEGEIRQAGGKPVAYIQISTFSDGLHDALFDEVERLYKKGAQGIVIDLRGNGGGLLEEAVMSSSLFVEDGTIVSIEGRTQPKQVFEAVGDAFPEKPLVVLINWVTASASEILTAALEQDGLAKVVGEKSFGKGTFQQVIELENDGALDLTVGEYLTRDGTSINHVGIKPQVPARDRPATKVDEGLQKALSTLGADLNRN